MENGPVIQLSSLSPAPGSRPSDRERQLKWSTEVYPTLILSIPQLSGIDNYIDIHKTFEYPDRFSITHYKNLSDWRTSSTSTQRVALGTEFKSWIDRGVIDYIWSAVYSLEKSYRGKPAFSDKNTDTRIENASILHIEAYRMSSEEQEKYVKWFNDFGSVVFMPLFMKLPGILGFDWYKNTGLRLRDFIGELDYPEYMSIVHFENLKAFEDFVTSAELDGFYKSMRSVLPRRLSYRWYVQYKLEQSYRK